MKNKTHHTKNGVSNTDPNISVDHGYAPCRVVHEQAYSIGTTNPLAMAEPAVQQAIKK